MGEGSANPGAPMGNQWAAWETSQHEKRVTLMLELDKRFVEAGLPHTRP